jgi:peptidoglycan/LPS O-acetylase OafA/YrhL
VIASETTPASPAPDLEVERAPGRVRSAFRHDLAVPSAWPLLDSLRGATVLAVVGWHVYRLSAPGVSPHAVPFYFWPLGGLRLGVDVFFVLSGFLVIRSWKSVRRGASNTTRSLAEFWKRRARRILPAYWFSLIVLLALTARPVLHNPRHVFLFFTLNEYVRFTLPAQVNVVYWSLTVEWHFYLLVPLLALLMTRVGRWPTLAACLVLSFMWWAHKPPMQLPQGFVFGHLDQFIAGAIVGELVVAHAAGTRSWLVRVARHPAFGAAVALGLFALSAYHGSTLGASRRNGFDPLLHPLFGLLAAAGILYLLATPRRAWLEHAALRALGLVSFSLYLWHYPILHLGIPWGVGLALLPPAIWLPVVIATFVALSIAVATLSYLLVERPFVAKKASSRAASVADGAAPVVHSSRGA